MSAPAVAAYIAALSAELAKLAQAEQLAPLAFILAMAREEAARVAAEAGGAS